MLNVAISKSICWTGLVLFLSSFQPACRNEWNSRSWGGYWVAEIFISLISFYSESSVFKVLIVYESVTSRLTWRKHGQNLRTSKPGCCFQFYFLMFSVRKSHLSPGWFRKPLNILSALFYALENSRIPCVSFCLLLGLVLPSPTVATWTMRTSSGAMENQTTRWQTTSI